MIQIMVLIIISAIAASPCEGTEDRPRGEPRECALVNSEICCEWHYVEDRYCTPSPDDDCSRIERAEDSMNALRSQESWCYKLLCGWSLRGEAYYNNWESQDEWSKANRKVRSLLHKKRYKRAKRLAKRSLIRLAKLGLCERDEPCDDHLEFVAYAPIKELKRAVKEWDYDLDP